MAATTLHKTLEGHRDAVQSVAFSPDNKLIASVSWDHTVRLWNIPSGDLNAELKGHTHDISSVAFSPDGESIVTGSWDKTVRTWSVVTNQQLKTLNDHSDKVCSVGCMVAKGDLIASGSNDRAVILWDAISGSNTKKLKGHTFYVTSVSFSQNGNKLASAGWDRVVIIWGVNSGAVLVKLVHSDYVSSVCFSPDDQFVVTGCEDNIVYMFNAKNGREKKRFEGHTNRVTSVACSFDGSMIASVSLEKSVRLWDVASTKQLQQLDGHTNLVTSVAFSHDGKFIASGSVDKTVCLWNAPSSLQRQILPKPVSPSGFLSQLFAKKDDKPALPQPVVSQRFCAALYDFAMTEKGVLSFEQNSILSIDGRDENGWAYAKLLPDGASGFIPLNHVEIISEAEAQRRLQQQKQNETEIEKQKVAVAESEKQKKELIAKQQETEKNQKIAAELSVKPQEIENAKRVEQNPASQIEYPIVIQRDPFVPVNTTGQETLAQLQALQIVTQDLIKSRLNEVSAQFQSNINDLMQQQQDLLAESHRDHEVRIKQLEEQVAEQKIALELFNAIVKPLDEWMRSRQLQTKEVDRIRQDEDFAAYYDTLQQVLNAAYTAALSVSSGIAVLNRNDTSAKVKKGLDLVGQHAGNVPFVSLVTGILSAVIDHFGEKNQREKLEKLLLLPNPTNMYTLFEDVARSATLSDARQTALKQPNQPESTFGEFFSNLKGKLVFSPRTTRSQKLAAADAERVLTYTMNGGLQGENDPNIIRQQLVATILQVDVKSISSNKPPPIPPKAKPRTGVSVDKVVADVKGDHKALADNQERVEVTLQAKLSALEQEVERQRVQIANQQSSHHRFIDVMSSLDEMEGQVSVENGATLAKVRQLILADADLKAFIKNRVFTFHLLRNDKLVKVNNEKIVLQADAVYIEFE